MAVWAAAWLNGVAASDDLLDALGAWAEAHDVRATDDDLAARLDLPGPGPQDTPVGPALLLPALRKEGASDSELILPVAGDVRGTGGAGAFGQAALRHGEGVVLRSAGLGLVPHSVADGVLRWTVFGLGEMPSAEHLPIGEAEHGMSSAMREAASTLIDLDIAKHRPGVRAEIAETVSSRPAAPWPETVPQRALRVLQRASEVEAILWVATDDAPGGALSASATRARVDALKPLFDSVRTARRSAVAEMVRILADQAQQS